MLNDESLAKLKEATDRIRENNAATIKAVEGLAEGFKSLFSNLGIKNIERYDEILNQLETLSVTNMPRKTKKAYTKLLYYDPLTAKERKRLKRWIARGNNTLAKLETQANG
jgi:hypothetical protein